MLVPLNWLRDFVEIERPLDDLTHLLSMAGLEVDAVHRPASLGEGFVVAQVTAIAPHPKADRLRLVTIDDGQFGRTVVCGAPNVEEGALVVLALPGAVLPDGRVLGEATIRGIPSAGMLCSEVELGRGDDHSGILILGGELRPGTPFEEAVPGAGPVIEIGLTPNRPDCLAIRGVAREIGALTGAPVSERPARLVEDPSLSAAALAQVEVRAGDRCPSYVGRVLEGVKIGPSPRWMVSRLAACGIRAINNVVDATNYVMLELGQPLHAFDLDQVAGQRIVVRMAQPGESLLFLDGVSRALDADDLMICDAERPVALAGVMGGEDSGVGQGTTRLLLESACFEPLGVRRCARRHGFHTDSSHRFERGVDPQGQQAAVDRLAELILQIAGGRLASGSLVAGPGTPERPPISVRPSAISSLLGVEVDAARIRTSLGALGIEVVQTGGELLHARPPSARVDLTTEADIAEEVARVIGYEQIPSALPLAPIGHPRTPPGWREKRAIEDYLGAQGLAETVTYAFISPTWLDRLRLGDEDPRRDMIRLVKPLSEEMSVMRPALVGSLLAAVAHNANRQSPDLGLFEIGRVFSRGPDGEAREADALGVVLSGRRHPRTWDRSSDAEVDIFDLKGILEGLEGSLGLVDVEQVHEDREPWLRPGHGLTLRRGETVVGVLGEVAPETARAFGIDARVYAAELLVDPWIAKVRVLERVPALPSHPRVLRDLAVVVGREVAAAAMVSAIRALAEPLIEDVQIFDVYEGKQIPDGSRSVGFSIAYRAPDRTLTEAEISEVHGRVLLSLERGFGATLRL